MYYEMIIISIILIICFLYYRLFFLYAKSWSNIPKNQDVNCSDSVSVIMACRNEEDNVINLIEDVRKQNFDKNRFEMIVVNDHSEDRTLEILQQKEQDWKQLTVISLEDERGKKTAIRKGIAIAKGDIILCTDADCRLGKDWMRTIVNYFSDNQILFVSSLVEYIYQKGLFQKFQSLDFLSLVASGACSIVRENPLFCNGANLAFRKHIYDTITEDRFAQFITDDISLLNYIHKNYPHSICVAKEKDTIARTKSNSTYRSFINQKIRWINFSRSENSTHVTSIAFIIFMMNFLIILFLFLAIFNEFYNIHYVSFLLSKYIFLGLFLVKCLSDYKFLSPVLEFFRRRDLIVYLFAFQIIYSFYISLIVPLSFIIKTNWKKRTLY